MSYPFCFQVSRHTQNHYKLMGKTKVVGKLLHKHQAEVQDQTVKDL